MRTKTIERNVEEKKKKKQERKIEFNDTENM